MKEIIDVSLSLDRAPLAPHDPTVANAVIEINVGKPDQTTWKRPPLSLVFTLDTSGSMKGPPLDNVIQSVDRLLSFLSPTDQVGIVTFSNNATLVMPLVDATEDTKKHVRASVHRLEADAMTNMEEGIRMSASLLDPEEEALETRRRLMLLLSDGVPNIGLCTPLTLAEMIKPLRPQISVWPLGYGPHHQEDILSAISETGGGRYHYIPEPQICEFVFAKTLGVQGEVIADAVEVVLRPAPGVEILRLIGKHATRFGPTGLTITLPDLFAKSRRVIVAELSLVPQVESGPWHVLTSTVSYRRTGRKEPILSSQKLFGQVSYSEAEIEPEAYAGVLMAQADEVRSEARSMADRGQFDGAAALLRDMLRKIKSAPHVDLLVTDPLSEARELLHDEVMAMEAKPATEQYKAFRRSQIGVELSGESYSVSSRHLESEYGKEVLREIAGEYPIARLQQLSGAEVGREVKLRSEQTVGRSVSADVVVLGDNIARRHTCIVAQRGEFFLMDLGAANGTWLNEARIDTHKLNHGDVIRVSDIKFRYSEDGTPSEPRLLAKLDDGNLFVVERDRLFVMGTSRVCTMILESDQVARRHAAVRYEDGVYYLEDYASEYGVYKNGKRINKRVAIEDNDRFILGDTAITFLFQG